jgi:hypothetical protein
MYAWLRDGLVRRGWSRLVLVGGLAGTVALGFCWGRYSQIPNVVAAPPTPAVNGEAEAPPPAPPEASTDYSRRVVAYIYGTIPISREDLGEYLIARVGADRLDLLVNKRIVEHECQEKHVVVTEDEIQGAIADDLKRLNVTMDQFANQVLKHYNKSLYEWREDVVRPRLAMTKLCSQRIHITDEDLKAAFDAHYGEKVDCRLIMWPKEEKPKVMNEIYAKIRDDSKVFESVATHQASSQLASTAGKIDPIGRHTTGNDELEAAAFRLHPDELSPLIETPEGLVVLKCVKRIPPDQTKKLETERAALEREVFERKLQHEMPNLFREMRDKAKPMLFLKKTTSESELKREVQQELQSLNPSKESQPPHGN